MLSAVVLTKNEEKNINDCLKTLDFCDEIIVIDDYSTDKAQSSKLKAQNHNLNLKIYERHLNGDFAKQRNFGLDKTKGDWVLFVDADERISPALAQEIKSAISAGLGESVSGFYFKRKDKFLGRWLNHGETTSVNLLRLARKDAGRWLGKIHEEWQIKGKIGEFKTSLLHDRKITVAQFLTRINQYSSIRSAELYEQGKTTNIFWVVLYPLGKFLQNYVFRAGFLDSMPGLIMAGMMSLHSFMVRAKLWVRQQNKGKEEFEIANWQKYA